MIPKYKVGEINISATNPDEAVAFIEELALSHKGGSIGVPCFRNIQVAKNDAHYASIMNANNMNIPDGMPLTWIGKIAGYKQVQQTPGPVVFGRILPHKESGIKHFLLGDTQETLDKVKSKYPDALIVGMVSPPFCPVEDFDYKLYAEQINRSGADIVWLSLTAPKQDFFAERLQPLISGKLIIGVGAAFRYVLGEYEEPSKVVKKLGLTGFIWRKWSFKLFWGYVRASGYLVQIAIKTIIHKKKI